MTYDLRRTDFSKEHIFIVELDLDYCTLTQGVAPCTATETGDAKCFNTLQSSNDVPNYDAGTKTYRFIQPRSPLPQNLPSILGADDPDVIPNLMSINIAPTIADPKGGLGVRSSVTINFKDHPHSDIKIDKYLSDRTYIASDKGTFWTKLRARNPNYQFRKLRVLSGYLVNGVFDSNNFTTRHYIVEKMNVANGQATIVAKDPLRLASNKKAQAPAPSTGQLQAAITAASGSLTLTPAGVGNSEYPASGKVRIDSEVISFTRVADVMTLTRAQNNTLAAAHNINATVQLCLEYTAQQVNVIVDDLLTNYASVDASFIPTTNWQTEVDTFLSGLISGIITKPVDVNKLLIELSESMPHYLWWDERNQVIEFTALKQPPESANALSYETDIINLSSQDKPEMRVSTVFINFGQFDPTKRLDEPSNYEQTYVRIDTDSIAKYGSSQIKVINSRWIINTNKAAALQAAALIGRRFSDPPRMIDFTLEAKNGDVWVGQNRSINHRDITDFIGDPVDTIFQMTSAQENDDSIFKYQGLEFNYGEELPEDEGGGDPTVDLVFISVDARNINLRTIYDGLFPAPDASTKAKFIVEAGVTVGSTSNGTEAMNTGTWPAGATVTLQTNAGSFVVGKGGNATAGNGNAGGDALHLAYDLTLINNGVIGGGGGAGGSASDTAGGSTGVAGGGGGAGDTVGTGWASSIAPGDGQPALISNGANGTLENGGLKGLAESDSLNILAVAGDGGDLGQAGDNASTGDTTFNGGAAGNAIDKNGFTLTEDVTGDIRGSIIA